MYPVKEGGMLYFTPLSPEPIADLGTTQLYTNRINSHCEDFEAIQQRVQRLYEELN